MFFPLRWEIQKLVEDKVMEISILAVNCRTFRFNRPCADGPFGSSRNNPPQRGAGTRDEPMEGPRPVKARPSAWRNWDLETTLHAEGSAGNYKRWRLPSADVHFVKLTSYLRIVTHWASLKKQSTRRLLEYVFQANVKTNKIVCDSKTTRVQEDTDISLSELEVT